MFKKKLILPILAVLIGGAASAFTTANDSYKPNSKATSYYWFNTSGVYQDLNTTTNEQSITGCDGTSSLCEKGYLKNQLINPNDPSQGVQQGEMPQEQIFHEE